MSIKVNGLRVGVLTALLAIGGAGCKKAPYKPMPKEFIPPRAETVIDSFYNEGLSIKNDPKYKLIYQDTIKLKNIYWVKPSSLQGEFNFRAERDRTPINEWDTDYYRYNDPKYIVASPQIFTKDGTKPYIAIAEYDK